jgi:hypothetical protein
MLKVTIELTGKAPLLSRNGRLANPLDEFTQQIVQLTKKKDKTLDDYRALLPLEAYAGLYWTKEGLIGWPTENIAACLIKAAAAYKQGTKLESALLFEPATIEVVLLDGHPVDAHEYVYDRSIDSLFIRTVVIGGRRTLRARAILKNWRTTHTFTLLDDIINPNDLKKIFRTAGRTVGLGDWRPRYGTFSTRIVEIVQLIEDDKEAA